MVSILGIGDNVVDIYLHTNRMYPGGNAVNVPVYAKFLGHSASYLGMFGDDRFADVVINALDTVGIERSHCRFEIGENGNSFINIEDGDRVFGVSNKGGITKEVPIILSKTDTDYISKFDMVHTSCYSYLENELEKIHPLSPMLSFDFSDRYSDEYLKKVCPNINCACVSYSGHSYEETLEFIEKIEDFGLDGIIIITRGSLGAVVKIGGKIYQQSACLVKPVDTIGAGDSFIAAFLTTYLDLVKNARDFPNASEAKGISTAEEFKDFAVRTALYKAAVFSSEICMKKGSFGFETIHTPE